MEPPAKKTKFEASMKQYEFLDMNDDCITLILEKLHKNDLCSTSFACKRLREIAYAVHMRKFPNKVITIKAQKDYKSDQIKVGLGNTDEKYLKYMSKAICNGEVLCTRKGIKDYFKVLKNECSSNLKSLRIHRARTNLSSMPLNMIKDQLKNLEKFSIETLPAKGIFTIHKNWLSCCQNLRELSITTQFCNGEWMLDVYPELESLRIHLLKIDFENDCFGRYAGQFFQRQPKLKEIQCVNFNTTRLLLRNVNSNISRLVVVIEVFGLNGLTFEETINQSIEFVDELKIYGGKNQIEWLEFALDHEIGTLGVNLRLSEIDAVHPVKGLRTKLSGSNGQSMIEMLKQLVYLELIVQSPTTVDWVHFSKEFPHMETLKLSFGFTNGNFKALDFTQPFVRNMPQLKRLDLTAGKRTVIEDDLLLQLNAARLLVKNPVHLHLNVVLMIGNKCKLTIPNSNILTTNVSRTENEDGSSNDSSDDSSSDSNDSDGSDEDLFSNYTNSDFETSSDSDDSDDSDSPGCVLC